ncbi:MAG: hypothetical protein WA419_09200 [Silvibacterium sp.]
MKALTSNTVGANVTATAYIDVSGGTNIQYQTSGYASSGATAMQYKGLFSSVPHQVKNLLFFLLLASATATAQSNQVSVVGVGNFNPVTYIYLYQPSPAVESNTVGSSQKSSLGGGAEYDHWFNPHQAFGVRYEQNPSDGKLLGAVNRKWYIWPQMRMELLGMFTEEVKVNRFTEQANRFTSFIQEGAGAVVTHEDDKGDKSAAGVSHSLAFAAGGGTDYWVNDKLAVRISSTIIAAQTGCYDDPTCRPTWGLSHDFEAGFSWKW